MTYIKSPRDAASLLIPVFVDVPSAVPLIVLLNDDHRVLETARADFALQAVYRIVLARRDAEAFVFARAALSPADLTPGPADLELARNMLAVGRYLYLDLYDYLIIGTRTYWSLKEQGQL